MDQRVLMYIVYEVYTLRKICDKLLASFFAKFRLNSVF